MDGWEMSEEGKEKKNMSLGSRIGTGADGWASGSSFIGRGEEQLGDQRSVPKHVVLGPPLIQL